LRAYLSDLYIAFNITHIVSERESARFIIYCVGNVCNIRVRERMRDYHLLYDDESF
jgi:hypothetical protein